MSQKSNEVVTEIYIPRYRQRRLDVDSVEKSEYRYVRL